MPGLLVAMAGLALGQLTGNMIFDGDASIVIGLILASAAALLARETKGLLIDESASQEVVDGNRSLVEKMPGVDRANEILTMHVGPDYVLVNISLMLSAEPNRTGPRPMKFLIVSMYRANRITAASSAYSSNLKRGLDPATSCIDLPDVAVSIQPPTNGETP